MKMEKVEKNEAQEAIRRSMQVALAKKTLKQIDDMFSKKIEEVKEFLSQLIEIKNPKWEAEDWNYLDDVQNGISLLLDDKLKEIKGILSDPDFLPQLNTHNVNKLFDNMYKTMNFLVPYRLITEDLDSNNRDTLTYESNPEIPF